MLKVVNVILSVNLCQCSVKREQGFLVMIFLTHENCHMTLSSILKILPYDHLILEEFLVLYEERL